MATRTLILVINLHFFIFPICVANYDNTEQQIINVDSIINIIDKQNYDTISVDIYGLCSEGSIFTGFFDKNQQLHKLVIIYFGEMGKDYEKYYLYKDSLIYKTLIIYDYNKPFYEEDYTMSIDTVSYNCVDNMDKCNKDDFYIARKLFMSKIKDCHLPNGAKHAY